MIKISILCSDPTHPVNNYIYAWKKENQNNFQIDVFRKKNELKSGNILFLISCSEVITTSEKTKFEHTLVLHASDLPFGRGWSPHIWQILEGKTEITLTLLEAHDKVDRGAIWKKIKLKIPKSALWNEINQIIFTAEIKLINFAIENYKTIMPTSQKKVLEEFYYPKRNPKDSEVNPSLSLESQFNILRVSDPFRYPAFFYLHDKKYKIILEQINDDCD